MADGVIQTYTPQQGLDVGGTVGLPDFSNAFGNALGMAADALGAVVERRQQRQEEDDRFNTEKGFLNWQLESERALATAQQNMLPGASGFHDGVMQSIEQSRVQFLASVPEYLRQDYELKTLQRFGDTSIRAATFESTERNNNFRNELNTVLGQLQNSIELDGSTSLDTYRQQGEDLINASGLSPAEKAEAVQSWREGAAESAFRAHLNEDPVGAARAFGLEPTPGADFDIPQDQRGRANFAGDNFAEFGFAPHMSAGIVGNLIQESGMNPNAVGDNGTAFGIAQWRGERYEALKRFAASRGKPWNDLQTQIAFINHELNTTEKASGDRLRAARTVEEATAAFIGYERPLGYTAANPRGGHGWNNRLAAAQTFAGEPTTSVRMVDPAYQDIPPARRLVLANEADRAIQQRRTEYLSGLQDYDAFLRDGNAPTGAYGFDESASILGEPAAQIVAEQLEDALAEGETRNAVVWATPGELDAITNEITASLSTPEGYRANVAEAERLATVIEARNAEIVADPAAYVLKDEGVARAQADMAQALSAGQDASQAAAAYAAASLNLQARLGVPEGMRTILPGAYRDAIVADFNNQPEGGQNAAQLMQALEQQWGRHWPQVYKELVEDGNLPDVAVVVGTMTREGQRVAAEVLANAAIVGQTELNKLVPDDRRTYIDDNLAGKMNDFVESVHGMPGRDALRYTEAIQLLATAYAQTESGQSALDRAYKDVLGVAYNYVDHNGLNYRVPAERNAGAINNGALVALDSLRGVGALPQSPMAARLDIPPPELGMSEEETRAAYLSHLESATWRTNADETGLALWRSTDNAVVTVDGGQPLTITWDELEALSLAQGRPSAADPVEELQRLRNNPVALPTFDPAEELQELRANPPPAPAPSLDPVEELRALRGPAPAGFVDDKTLTLLDGARRALDQGVGDRDGVRALLERMGLPPEWLDNPPTPEEVMEHNNRLEAGR